MREPIGCERPEDRRPACRRAAYRRLALSVLAIASALGAAMTFSSAAWAHHSFTVLFDPSQEITVSGEVVRFDFKAPHAYIYLKVTADDGTSAEWELESTSPGQLIRKGVTPETLHPGDAISVYGNPSRDGRLLMRVITLTTADGEEKQLQ